MSRYWPIPVRIFAIAYLGWIAFSFANSLLVFETLRQTLSDSMASAQPVGDWAVYALLAIRITVELLLWLAVLKRQSIIATVIIGAQMVGRMLGVPAEIGRAHV